MKTLYTINLSNVGMKDINLVGGKNASLGEMITGLTQKGIKVPSGFAITVEAFKFFISFNKLDKTIKDIVDKSNLSDLQSLRDRFYRLCW